MEDGTRRHVLRLAGIGLAATVAGCGSPGGEGEEEEGGGEGDEGGGEGGDGDEGGGGGEGGGGDYDVGSVGWREIDRV